MESIVEASWNGSWNSRGIAREIARGIDPGIGRGICRGIARGILELLVEFGNCSRNIRVFHRNSFKIIYMSKYQSNIYKNTIERPFLIDIHSLIWF